MQTLLPKDFKADFSYGLDEQKNFKKLAYLYRLCDEIITRLTEDHDKFFEFKINVHEVDIKYLQQIEDELQVNHWFTVIITSDNTNYILFVSRSPISFAISLSTVLSNDEQKLKPKIDDNKLIVDEDTKFIEDAKLYCKEKELKNKREILRYILLNYKQQNISQEFKIFIEQNSKNVGSFYALNIDEITDKIISFKKENK